MAKKRLLVVDDEPGFVRLVERVAADLDYQVTTANRGSQFRALHDEIQPDVVILDIVMPEVDGIELVQWLAERGTKAEVILVTGYNPSYAEAAKILADVKGLVSVRTFTKPVSIKDLREVLAANSGS